MISRDDVIKVARSYIGVKFRLHGRDRTGLDCVGLIFRVLQDLGIELPDDANYTRNIESEKLNAIIEAHSTLAPSGVFRTGQLLKIRQFVFPMHTAFLAIEKGRMTVIHANVKRQQVLEQEFSMWKELVMEYREINGVR
jgi:hypothetical protein